MKTGQLQQAELQLTFIYTNTENSLLVINVNTAMCIML